MITEDTVGRLLHITVGDEDILDPVHTVPVSELYSSESIKTQVNDKAGVLVGRY